MPSTDEHIKQATHNEKFVGTFNIKISPYLDWALTGIFYSAIHYIEAFLALPAINKHPMTHAERNTFISLHINNQDVYAAHRDLRDDSRDVRYKCIQVSETEINKSKIKLENVKNYLKTSLPQII